MEILLSTLTSTYTPTRKNAHAFVSVTVGKNSIKLDPTNMEKIVFNSTRRVVDLDLTDSQHLQSVPPTLPLLPPTVVETLASPLQKRKT
jgi:hypothetical protein